MKWSRIVSRAAAWLAVSCLVGCGGDRREETALPSSAAQPDARAPQSEASGAAPESAPAPAETPSETTAEDPPGVPAESPPETAAKDSGGTAAKSPTETSAQDPAVTPVKDSSAAASDAENEKDFVYGAESPQDLLERIAAALKNKDRKSFRACLHPPTASEAEKADAEQAADTMFACLRARELLSETAERFGKEELPQEARPAVMMLGLFAMSPTIFEEMPEKAQIEQNGATATIRFTVPMGFGGQMHEAHQTREVHLRDDGRWYLLKAGQSGETGTTADLQSLEAMVAAFEHALDASETIEQFRENLAPLAKGMVGSGPMAPAPPKLPKEAALSPQAAREAVQWALSTGASATVHVEGRTQPVSVRRQDDIPAEDFRLTGLKLNFHHEYSQEEFRRIGAMKDLLDLGCFTTDSVDDSMLSHLARLENLRTLNLRSTPVTGEGFADLTSLQTLEHLELAGCPIVDAGLEHIGGLKGLTGLDLSHTEITDAGLEHLKTLTNLRSLNVSRTGVTAAGVAELESALPNCRITPTAAELRGSAEARIWRDPSGEFSVEAELVEVADGRLTLKRTADGKLVTVPLERLSATDREFIESAGGAMPDWLTAPAEHGGFSTGFGNWIRKVHALGAREWRILVEACRREDVEWWGHMRRIVQLLNSTSGDQAADKAVQLAEASENIYWAAALINAPPAHDVWKDLRGAQPEHKADIRALMWKWFSESHHVKFESGRTQWEVHKALGCRT